MNLSLLRIGCKHWGWSSHCFLLRRCQNVSLAHLLAGSLGLGRTSLASCPLIGYRWCHRTSPYHFSSAASSSSGDASSSRMSPPCTNQGFHCVIVTRIGTSSSLYHDGDDLLGRGGAESLETEEGWWKAPPHPHGHHRSSPLQGVLATRKLPKFVPIHILPRCMTLEGEDKEWRRKHQILSLPSSPLHSNLSSSTSEKNVSLSIPRPTNGQPQEEEEKVIKMRRKQQEEETSNPSLLPASPPLLINRLHYPSSTHISLRSFLALRHCWISGKYFHIPTWNGWYLLAPSWTIPDQVMERGSEDEEDGGNASGSKLPLSSTSLPPSLERNWTRENKMKTSALFPFFDEKGVQAWVHRIHPRYRGWENELSKENQENEENDDLRGRNRVSLRSHHSEMRNRVSAEWKNKEKGSGEDGEDTPATATTRRLQEFRHDKASELYDVCGTAAWERSVPHSHHGHNNQVKGMEKEIYDPYGLEGGKEKGRGGEEEEEEERHRDEEVSLRGKRKGKMCRTRAKQKRRDSTLYYIPEEHLFELNDGIQWPLLTSTLVNVMRNIFEENNEISPFIPVPLDHHEDTENGKTTDEVLQCKDDMEGLASHSPCDANGHPLLPSSSVEPPPPELHKSEGVHKVRLDNKNHAQLRSAVGALVQFYRRHLQRLEVYDSTGGGWSPEEEDMFIHESLEAWQTLVQHLRSLGTRAPLPPDVASSPPSLPSKPKVDDNGGEIKQDNNNSSAFESLAKMALDSTNLEDPMAIEKQQKGNSPPPPVPPPASMNPFSAFPFSNDNTADEQKSKIMPRIPTEEEVVGHAKQLFRAYTQKANCQLTVLDRAYDPEGADYSSSSSASSTPPPLVTLVPLVDIPEGAELTLHYGREWWTEHFLYPLLLLRENVVEWNHHHYHQARCNTSCTIIETKEGEGDDSTTTSSENASLTFSSSTMMKWVREVEQLVACPEDVFEPFPILRPTRVPSKRKKKKSVNKNKVSCLPLQGQENHLINPGHLDGPSSDDMMPLAENLSKFHLYNVSTKQRASSAAVVAVAVQQSIVDSSWFWNSVVASPCGIPHNTDPTSPSMPGSSSSSLPASHVFDVSSPDKLVPIFRLGDALKRKLLQKKRHASRSPTSTPISVSNEDTNEAQKKEKVAIQQLRLDTKYSSNLSSLYSTVLQRWWPSRKHHKVE